MKYIVTIFVLLALCGGAFAQGAPPYIGKWKTSGTFIYNSKGDSAAVIIGTDTTWFGANVIRRGLDTISELGPTIETGEMTDGTITEPDLNITNAPTGLDGYLLSLNEGGGNFTWITGGAGETNTLGDTGTYNETEGFGLAGGKTGTVLKVKGLIEGSNVTIAKSGDSGLTITSSGGAAWVASNDTMFMVDGDGDTLAAFWDDDAGNVRWQVATEDQTLRLLVDTIGINGETIYSFTGTNLSVTDGVLNAAVGGAGGWTDDGNYVRLTTVGDSVGIGTTTPDQKLEVSANIKALQLHVVGIRSWQYPNGYVRFMDTTYLLPTKTFLSNLAPNTDSLVAPRIYVREQVHDTADVLRAEMDDSATAVAEVLIEDSLNEYSLTSAIASLYPDTAEVVDTIQGTVPAIIEDSLNCYFDTAAVVDTAQALDASYLPLAGGALTGAVTTNSTFDTVDVATLAAKVHNEDLRHFGFAILDPNTVYDTDSLICIKPVTEKAITVTRIDVTCDADPATEPAMSLRFADNFISRTTPTTIDVITTAVGVTTITSGFDDATIPAANCVYFVFTADPLAAIKSINVDITYTID